MDDVGGRKCRQRGEREMMKMMSGRLRCELGSSLHTLDQMERIRLPPMTYTPPKEIAPQPTRGRRRTRTADSLANRPPFTDLLSRATEHVINALPCD